MKNIKISLIAYMAMSTSLLLSACGADSQTRQQSAHTDSSTNSVITSKLVNMASSSSAHWLTPSLLVMPKSDKAEMYQLLNTSKEVLEIVMLYDVSFPEHLAEKFPHLADFQAYSVSLTPAQVKRWLKQQFMVIALDREHQTQGVSFVQTGAVLDALYTEGKNDANEEENLGATVTETGVSFKLWAPTAQQVDVLLFDEQMHPMSEASLAMTEDTKTGIWSIDGDSSLNDAYYQYQVTVYHPESKKVETLITTDPYSLSLSVNSQYSQVVDLSSPSTQPDNWQNHQVPRVANVEDYIFYETHIRDFSSAEKALSNAAFRGKYKAFSEQASYGITHLKALKKAGLNNIHLLPTYDFATVNEDASQSVDINDTVAEVKNKVCDIAPTITICTAGFNNEQTLNTLLKSFDVSSEQVQKVVSELRQFDNFNWGYDPFHYTVPEGSYALNPQGKSRLVEFREMVQSIHALGFRVIMDVVYNHTYQFGLKEKSVLDKVVPNYYHRLNTITGEVEQSTCYTCGNTATERVMMAKLMSDSLVTWARDYKIDGFRFDLMGHQTKTAMLAAREAVRVVDADTYFYGEGWNFGEVANNNRFVQASQLELGGTEIGTYSDRLRDAVRGSGNNTRGSQGVGNGLFLLPNERQPYERQVQGSSTQKNNQQGYAKQEYSLRMNQLRVGLAGNLSTFPLYRIDGKQVLGKDVPYGDQPTGYALDPADTINYVSKHDNQTLWDNSQYRLPFDVSTQDRVRMHLQSLAFVLYAQGMPFLHMGSEFMRSKSYLRDSYDYGDWFNRVDFTKQTNHYNVGLPPADKDKENWPLIKEVIKGHQSRDQVSSKDIDFSSKAFEEMIALRMSSPLFRLTTAKDIIEKVSFLNVEDKLLGLLVMKLDDIKGNSVDENVKRLMVIFNTSTQTQTFAYPKAKDYQLHQIQKNSVDNVIKGSQADEKGFTVPALSSAVFVSN